MKTKDYNMIFYRNNNLSGYDLIKVKLDEVSCEKFCKEKGFIEYAI